MATTKTQKNTAKEVTEVQAARRVSKDTTRRDSAESKILGLRITEKSALLSAKGAYTFNVTPGTNKSEIAKLIKAQYKVTPVKINITKRTKKVVFLRGKLGTKAGGTKAVVYLKKGDKIEFA